MSDKICRAKTMSISHADFLRTFTSAYSDDGWTFADGAFTLVKNDSRARVTLGPEGRLNIALLSLPSTEVGFEFEGYSATRVESFMERFDRHFRRGGG